MSEYDGFIMELEQLGESKVKENLSQGVWANRRKERAEDWIQNKESLRKENRDERTLVLAEEANGIARSALDVAKRSKTISIIAIIVSVLVAVGTFYGKHSQ